jgi:hypothetical protein
MSDENKKGITVKIDAALHAQVRKYLDAHNMTMAEFVTQALDNELHPKTDMKEGAKMEKTRTLAIQIPEEMFQRIKDYLQRNNMTQKQFLIGLIEDELERDLTEREAEIDAVSEEPELEDKYPTQVEEADVGYFSGESEEEAEEVYEEEQAAPQESYPSYAMGISM